MDGAKRWAFLHAVFVGHGTTANAGWQCRPVDVEMTGMMSQKAVSEDCDASKRDALSTVRLSMVALCGTFIRTEQARSTFDESRATHPLS
jgi:hypothetical protein